MNDSDYENILELAVANGTMLAGDNPALAEDVEELHRQLFAMTLSDVDTDELLSYVTSKDVSEICYEVAGDICYGDILGVFN